MFGSQPSRSASSDKGEDYWITISDLMMGLLMVFALMLLAALFHYGTMVEEAAGITETRAEIIARLDSAFSARLGADYEEGGPFTIDPETGDFGISEDAVRFEAGQYTLDERARRHLQQVAAVYFPVLLADSTIRNALDVIVIEGHTDDTGYLDDPYAGNLRLSQDRAFSVMEFVRQTIRAGEAGHSANGADELVSHLEQYVIASGRSFSDPILCPATSQDEACPPGEIDRDRSRRIRIFFRLDEGEALREIERMLRPGA